MSPFIYVWESKVRELVKEKLKRENTGSRGRKKTTKNWMCTHFVT